MADTKVLWLAYESAGKFVNLRVAQPHEMLVQNYVCMAYESTGRCRMAAVGFAEEVYPPGDDVGQKGLKCTPLCAKHLGERTGEACADVIGLEGA